VKTVVPWFTGRPMTEQEMQWENRITYVTSAKNGGEGHGKDPKLSPANESK